VYALHMYVDTLHRGRHAHRRVAPVGLGPQLGQLCGQAHGTGSAAMRPFAELHVQTFCTMRFSVGSYLDNNSFLRRLC
jgi:hypothetical protein